MVWRRHLSVRPSVCLSVHKVCKHNTDWTVLLLNARLVGTYYGMARASACPSICLSVHKDCKHNTDWTVLARTIKLGTVTTYDRRTNPIDFQGQGSKVKVTRYTVLLNLVNTIQTELFKLGPSNLVHILLKTRGQHLLTTSPASSVGRASDFESKGWGFESHCGKGIFHFVFCRFRRAPGRSTGPMQMKSSMTSIRDI